MSLEQSLHWHLSCNHFPPVTDDFIPPAMRAIKKVQKLADEYAYEYDTRKYREELLSLRVRMPDTNYPRGEKQRLFPVVDLMDGLHLWDYVTFHNDDDWEDEEEND